MYKYVIFDLDGTLLDTLQDLAAACNHTLKALKLPEHPVEAYKKMVGNGIPNLIERMLPQDACSGSNIAMARSIFESYYAQHMRDLTRPYPGIPELLRTLKSKKVTMGVASNKQDDFTRAMVDDFFPRTFKAVIGLRPDMMPKPDPGCVQWLMKEMFAKPSETLYVGDSDVDMATAANAGLAGCGVLWGFRDRMELYVGGARFMVSTAAELESLILSDSPDPALLSRPDLPAGVSYPPRPEA